MKHFISKHSVWITLLPVLAIMALIFSFSAQKGEASSQTSGRYVQWIIEHFCPEFDEMREVEQIELKDAISHVVRKTAHFIEFGALGFFLMLHIWTIKRRIGVRFPKLLSQLIGTTYAFSDELHQKLVNGREAALSDVLLDSAGVLFGTLMMALLLFILLKAAERRAKKKRPNEISK